MLFRALTCVLTLAVVAEGGYILLRRHPINRFKAVDADGYVASDTATGQLCKTIRMQSSSKSLQYSPSADHAPERYVGNAAEDKTSKGYDRLLDAIRNSPSNTDAAEDYRLEVLRGLPVCADLP